MRTVFFRVFPFFFLILATTQPILGTGQTYASTVVFTPTKVADTNTPIPDGTESFFGFSSPSLDGPNVAFLGFSPFPDFGIYLHDGIILRSVVNNKTAVPGGLGTFASFLNPSLAGNNLAFTGFIDVSGSSPVGVYTVVGGFLNSVADVSTNVPNGAGTFRILSRVSFSGGKVAFEGGAMEQIPGQGIYTDLGGVLRRVADQSTAVPGTTNTFISVGYPAIDAGVIAFWGRRQPPPAFEIHDGIYKEVGGSLQVVVDSDTAVPGEPGAFFSQFVIGGDDLSLHDGSVSFGAGTTNGKQGIYTDVGGSLHAVVTTDTEIPEGTGTFTNLTAVSLHSGKVAFRGEGQDGQEGIYVATADAIIKVIDLTDTLDGKSLRPGTFGSSTLRLGPEGLNGNSVAFMARFADGSSGIYKVQFLEDVSDCETTLPFAWPTAFGASRVSQDYAEFNGSDASRREHRMLVKPHYHTGMDLSSPVPEGQVDRSQEVFAAARGEVVAVCPKVSPTTGCSFGDMQFSTNAGNHGLQGVVILKHTVLGSDVVYSLYAHLGTVETFQPGECIDQGTLIGATGGLDDGHLHFEMKSTPVLSNPGEVAGTCIDPLAQTPSQTCYGYTLVNPNTRGYHDPVEYLHLLDTSGFPKAVTLSDDKDKKKKINVRSGPGAFLGAYGVVGKAEEGAYTALSQVFGTTADPSCVGGWYQIQRASTDCSVLGNCFTAQNSKTTKDSVPEAWVCGDFVKE